MKLNFVPQTTLSPHLLSQLNNSDPSSSTTTSSSSSLSSSPSQTSSSPPIQYNESCIAISKEGSVMVVSGKYKIAILSKQKQWEAIILDEQQCNSNQGYVERNHCISNHTNNINNNKCCPTINTMHNKQQ
jgi:hypothetical protein